jgi:hypothetical protein
LPLLPEIMIGFPDASMPVMMPTWLLPRRPITAMAPTWGPETRWMIS